MEGAMDWPLPEHADDHNLADVLLQHGQKIPDSGTIAISVVFFTVSRLSGIQL